MEKEIWEKPLYQLIKEYGNAAYLVSEENHDEAEELAVMSACIDYVRHLLLSQKEQLAREVEGLPLARKFMNTIDKDRVLSLLRNKN